MYNNIEKKLNEILTKKPPESACIEYKDNLIILNEDKGKFIQLINGFVNSIDGFGYDKFIVFGVKNDDKRILGLREKMPDDNKLQKLINKITPRPSIVTGEFEFNDNGVLKFIGYVFIPADKNTKRVYSINSDHPNHKPKTLEEREKNAELTHVYASTAWIRLGSSLDPIKESERLEIYEMNRKEKNILSDYNINRNSLLEIDKFSVLKRILMLGSWDDNNKNDRKIVEDITEQSYLEVSKYLQKEVNEKNSSFEFINGNWKIKDCDILLEKYSKYYFKEDFLIFRKVSIKILSKIDSRYNLPSRERALSRKINENEEYSKSLISSIVNNILFIKANYKKFINSQSEAKNLSLYVVSEVLENNNWELWATLDKNLPYLAECEPNKFLDILQEKIQKEPEIFKKLIEEKEMFVVEKKYTTGLYNSLELLAWSEEYLSTVCVILIILAKYDEYAIKVITKILLPQYPQTLALFEIRVAAIKCMIKEDLDIAWKVLLELMPGAVNFLVDNYKPILIDKLDIEKRIVTLEEYWFQVEKYVKILILNAKNDVYKLVDLVNLLDIDNEKIFNEIMKKLSQKQLQKLSQEKKYYLWDKIEDFIAEQKQKSKKQFSNKKMKEVENLSILMKPSDPTYYYRRYFKEDWFLLREDYSTYNVFLEKLNKQRIDALKKIYKENLKNILEFVKLVEIPELVGESFVKIINNFEEEKKIFCLLNSKNKKEIRFSKTFFKEKYLLNGIEYLNKFDFSSLEIQAQLNLFLILPINNQILEKIKKCLKDKENLYWKNLQSLIIKDDIDFDINMVLKKLILNNRYNVAIKFIYKLLQGKKRDFDKKLALEVLQGLLNFQEQLGDNIYAIQEIIKNIQKTDEIDEEEKAKIEWSYLEILNTEGNRSFNIEKILSKNPKKFIEMLILAYKPESKTKEEHKFDKNIAWNAYKILDSWKIPPGLTKEGNLIEKDLNEWYKDMKKRAKKEDRLSMGLYNFGKVLFYSPKNKRGIWNKSVLNILDNTDAERIRAGFINKAFNSVGLISLSKEINEYDRLSIYYKNKAEIIEKKGYIRVANSLRKLSESFKRHSKDFKEEF